MQSPYFAYQQFSFYTVAAYHKEGIEKMAIITPDKDHSHAVILNKLKEKVSSLRKETFWSDGCSSQFKCQHVFLDLTDLDRDIGLEWICFESNHGKGAIDGIGGCVKQNVLKHVRSFKVVLSNAEEFVSYANKVMEDTDIIYHGTSKILYALKEALAVQLTGTQKVRMIQHSIGTSEVTLSFYTHIQVQQISLL